MTEQHQHTNMRRHDRQVTDEEWIVRFLHTADAGVIATIDDGRPFVNVNTFVYDPPSHSLYFHSAGHGRLRTNVDAGGRASFVAYRMGRLLPAEVAREFSVEYDSVVAFGTISIIIDLKEARDKMQLLIDKYFPHLKPDEDYRPITPAEVKEISAYRFTIESWSAKRKVVEADFPGAFRFGEK